MMVICTFGFREFSFLKVIVVMVLIVEGRSTELLLMKSWCYSSFMLKIIE